MTTTATKDCLACHDQYPGSGLQHTVRCIRNRTHCAICDQPITWRVQDLYLHDVFNAEHRAITWRALATTMTNQPQGAQQSPVGETLRFEGEI